MLRLTFAIVIALVAFAGNSVLNRLALADGHTGPAAFALLRLVSGAVILAALLLLRSRRQWPQVHVFPAMSLALYAIGFSFAYVSLETGAGALILFGGVQLTLFALALRETGAVPVLRWISAAIAFGGLVVLFWPTQSQVYFDALSAGLMGAAALGWGFYTYFGRSAGDPLAFTASNFIFATPLAGVVFLILPDGMTTWGMMLAICSGAVTSGLGYAIWYYVLPKTETSLAGILQLSVPILAALMGAMWLDEPLTLKFGVAASLVVAGTALALLGPNILSKRR